MFEDLDEAWQNERLTRSRRHAFEQDPCDDECATTGSRWKIHPFVLVVVIVVLVALSAVGIWRALGGSWPWSGMGGQRTDGTSQSGAYAAEVYEWEEQNAGSSSDSGMVGVENSSGEGKIYVYVTGEVADPGLYELVEGDRVAKAIELAGNLTEEADTTAVNLARVVADGEHVHIPKIGEVVSGSGTSSSSASGSVNGSSGTSSVSSCINLNSASASELEELDGIGPTLASRIVAFREENGAFTSVEQVDAVSGIGPSLVQRISEKACV